VVSNWHKTILRELPGELFEGTIHRVFQRGVFLPPCSGVSYEPSDPQPCALMNKQLSFQDFEALASQPGLQAYERVGFKAVHRKKTEKNIFPDLLQKIPALNQKNKNILEIGCGCSLPARSLIAHCKKKKHRLVLVDSAGMLARLPDHGFLKKAPHQFPQEPKFLKDHHKKFDVIIIYGVVHAIYEHQSVFTFLDRAVSLLKEGGSLLVGDLANLSKKRRFLSSPAGRQFHKRWAKGQKAPPIRWLETYEDFDDSVIFQLLLRYRLMGLETYLLPQAEGLPLNQTREDLLIVRR